MSNTGIFMDVETIINPVNPDSVSEMSIIEQEINKQVTENTLTYFAVQYGHVYPVMLVQSWTKELQGYNTQLNNFIKSYQELNLKNVDKNWLRTKIQDFVKWINEKLANLRQKIVNSLKAMNKQVSEAIEIISTIVNFDLSIDSIVGWAKNVINYFTGPYGKLVQFIVDFTTYTPPLVTAAAQLATTTVTAAPLIISKTDELTDEGSEVVKEEIANAVGGITFEPINIGDLK